MSRGPRFPDFHNIRSLERALQHIDDEEKVKRKRIEQESRRQRALETAAGKDEHIRRQMALYYAAKVANADARASMAKTTRKETLATSRTQRQAKAKQERERVEERRQSRREQKEEEEKSRKFELEMKFERLQREREAAEGHATHRDRDIAGQKVWNEEMLRAHKCERCSARDPTNYEGGTFAAGEWAGLDPWGYDGGLVTTHRGPVPRLELYKETQPTYRPVGNYPAEIEPFIDI